MNFKEVEFNSKIAKDTLSSELSEDEVDNFRKIQNNYLLNRALFFNGKYNFLDKLIESRIRFDMMFELEKINRNIPKEYGNVQINYELMKIYFFK